MTNETSSNGAAEVNRLRADIDQGRTEEKISVSDPAASPLGTDDEAAGTPAKKADATAVRHDEVKAAPRTPPEEHQHGFLTHNWPFIVMAVVAVLAVITVIVFR